MNRRRPVALLTGFLGSGKTTLLNRALRDPSLANAAVIVNEFGEVGIDGLLVERVDEATVLLESGCVCCTVRTDLAETLSDLAARSRVGTLPDLDRAIVETTGLADPAPVAHTLTTHPATRADWHLEAVVATLDARAGLATLDRHHEAVKQLALADTVVLTKGDLVGPGEAETVGARARAINPAARVLDAADAPSTAALFSNGLVRDGRADLSAWLGPVLHRRGHPHRNASDGRHGTHDGIETVALTFETPLDWADVSNAFDLLIQLHGPDLLRVKGVLNVEGHAAPVVVHGVQGVFHPPASLAAWQGPPRSQLVFITRGVSAARIAQLVRPLLGRRETDRPEVA